MRSIPNYVPNLAVGAKHDSIANKIILKGESSGYARKRDDVLKMKNDMKL